MERILGPIRRHYLAAYTVPSAEGHYGYAKVCASKPESAWESMPVLMKVAAGPFLTEAEALTGVIDKAAEHLREASEFHLLWDEGTPVER